MNNHPSDEELELWLGRRMEQAAYRLIEAHLEICRDCEARLDAVGQCSREEVWRRRAGDFQQHEPIKLPAPTSPGFIGRLERFDVKKSLGWGGMGEVFLAYDSRVQGRRPVAIKVIKPILAAQPEFLRRFRREADTASQVKSDYVVGIIQVEIGGGDGCLSFLVMEYIEGKTLDKQIKSAKPIKPAKPNKKTPAGGLEPRYAAQIALHVAQGLVAVHTLGLVHRDIKPSNIMLDVKTRRARITDFGLARSVDSGLARTRGVIGTPEYMSPEQFESSMGEIGHRSDIYSLGVVLYEMLIGERPFCGDTGQQLSRRVVYEAPKPPRSIDPKIPPELEIICLACLEKFPKDRFFDAAELVADLTRYLAGHPIKREKPTPAHRLRLFVRRHRTLVRFAAVFALIATIGGSGLSTALWHTRNESAAKSGVIEKQTETIGIITKEVDAAKVVVKTKTEIAERKSKEAEAKSREAADRKQREQRTRYLSEIKDAFKAWGTNAPGEARALLDRQIPSEGSGEPDRRGVEWYYLDHELKHAYRRIDFNGTGLAVRFSPDGERLAAFGIDRAVRCVRLWKLSDAKLERELVLGRPTTGLIDPMDFLNPNIAGSEILAFNRDGSLIAATYYVRDHNRHGGLVKVWETATGREKLSVFDAAIAGKAIVFTPDGKSVLAGGFNNAALAYNLADGTLGWTLLGYSQVAGAAEMARALHRPGLDRGTHQGVDHLLFSPNGRYLTRSDGMNGHRAQSRATDPQSRGFLLAPNAFGRSKDSPVPNRDAFVQNPESFFRSRTSGVDTVLGYNNSRGYWGISRDVSPDGVRLFHPLDDTGERPIPGANGEFTGVPRSIPGIYDSIPIKIDQGEIATLAFEGSALALADKQGRVSALRFDINKGTVLQRTVLRGHKGKVAGLSMSSKGGVRLAAIGFDGVTIWENLFAAPGNNLFVEDSGVPHRPGRGMLGGSGRRRFDCSVSLSPEGKRCIEVAIYDMNAPTDAPPRKILTPVSGWGAVALSLDGSRLAISPQEGGDPATEPTFCVLDAVSGAIIHARRSADGAPNRLAFDPTGRVLLSSTRGEAQVRLWDVETGKALGILDGKDEEIARAEFSPDGRWIVTGNDHQKLTKIWNVAERTLVTSFPAATIKSVWAMTGDLLAIPATGQRIRIWDFKQGKTVPDLDGPEQTIDDLVFLAGGKRLLSRSSRTLTLWAVDDESRIGSFDYPTNYTGDLSSIAETLERLTKEIAP